MSTTTESQAIDPKFIFFSLFTTKGLDLFTTYVALTMGFGFEANPISATFIKLGGYSMLIAVVMIATACACFSFVFSQKILEKRNVPMSYKIFVRYFIYLCILINFVVVLNNMYVIHIGSMV
jgi:hypothetical protein